MKDLNKNGFIILGIALMIMLGFQIVNFISIQQYKEDNDGVSKEARDSRKNLITMITVSNERDQDVQQKLLRLLNRTADVATRVYYIANASLEVNTFNQQLLHTLVGFAESQANNLNLTKYNRMALLDSNLVLHKIWENLTDESSCHQNPLAGCIGMRNNSSLIPDNTKKTAPDN